MQHATRRRTTSLSALAAILLIGYVGGTALGATAAEAPNIVLVMADDQGYGDVGYYGQSPVKTPTLDAMAAEALRLDRFYAAAPVCSPTRGSVMTGRNPNRFGCFAWGRTLRPEEITVAEALKEAGYVTGHFGKWHLGPVTGKSCVTPGASGFDVWFSSPNFFDNDPLMSREGKVVRTQGESSHVTVDAAIEFLREVAPKQQPFLAVVWFGSPHGPHRATEEYRKMYADEPEKARDFLGEITGMDAAIGRLRAELRELGVAENTLFWYTSDNGALSVGSTCGLRGRKGQIYEGGLRVPAIIEWPAKIRKPRICDTVCGTVDIYPTLLDIVGLAMPDQPATDGVSLLPLLDGEELERPPLGFWAYPVGGISTPSREILARVLARQEGTESSAGREFHFPEPTAPYTQYPSDNLPGHSAWLDGDYKLHRVVGKKPGAPSYEFYDLAADPAETIDVAEQHAERVSRMKKELEAWQRSVVKSLNGGDYAP